LIQHGIGRNHFLEAWASSAEDFMYRYIQLEEIKERKESRKGK
jgi:hypothetical protein